MWSRVTRKLKIISILPYITEHQLLITAMKHKYYKVNSVVLQWIICLFRSGVTNNLKSALVNRNPNVTKQSL